MKIKFYMSMKDGTFIESVGRLLTPDLVAHNVEGQGWRITDYSSGRLVKSGFTMLRQCKEFVDRMPPAFKSKLSAARNKPSYKEACTRLSDYVKGLLGSDNKSMK